MDRIEQNFIVIQLFLRKWFFVNNSNILSHDELYFQPFVNLHKLP